MKKWLVFFIFFNCSFSNNVFKNYNNNKYNTFFCFGLNFLMQKKKARKNNHNDTTTKKEILDENDFALDACCDYKNCCDYSKTFFFILKF